MTQPSLMLPVNVVDRIFFCCSHCGLKIGSGGAKDIHQGSIPDTGEENGVGCSSHCSYLRTYFPDRVASPSAPEPTMVIQRGNYRQPQTCGFPGYYLIRGQGERQNVGWMIPAITTRSGRQSVLGFGSRPILDPRIKSGVGIASRDRYHLTREDALQRQNSGP